MSLISASFARSILSFLVTPLLAGIVLTILAPLGTHDLGLIVRAVFWIGLCVAGGLGAMATQLGLSRLSSLPPRAVQTVLRSLGATLAVSPFVLFAFGAQNPFNALLTLFYVWVIAIVITAVSEAVAHRNDTAAASAQIERPALMERLPLKFQDADLYAAVSEDHYVRIYTSNGEHMLLMRLSDVSDLAHPVEGLSPHRSWWVATAGVAEVMRGDGKMTLLLKSGVEVPVSRAGAKRVRDAGWLG